MSIPGAANPLLLATAAAGGYQISRSLRFSSIDSAFLSRTPSSTGNRKTWTWAGWVKRVRPTWDNDYLFGAYYGGSLRYEYLAFTSSDRLEWFSGLYDIAGTTTSGRKITSAVFRDTSAWYHVVAAKDTTQATAANRFKLYVNGVQISLFDTSTDPALNDESFINDSSTPHRVGGLIGSANSSQYLADVFFIDGQALDPSSFVETSATTGRLEPKQYAGSFGTNGFWLKFSDNSAATATTLGKDYSGNGNNWTPNNLSVTAGAGNDSLVDTPTSGSQVDTGLGGQVTGNYCTLNPLSGNPSITLRNGNLERSGAANNKMGTIGMSSGKWYWEVVCNTLTGDAFNGITEYQNEPTDYALNYAYTASSGTKWVGYTQSSYGASYAVGDVIGFAYNADSGSLTCYKNGVSQGVLVSGLSGKTLFPLVRSDGTAEMVCNFGQRPFAYTAPSGFKALCDTNLPAPVVAKSASAFDVKLYTGNGSTQTISGLGFSPDWVWIKSRSTTYSHYTADILRGVNSILATNSTNGEASVSGSITAFNSDGFSVGNELSTNASGTTYAAWCWDAGSSTVSNTQGSITSSVRTNNYLSIVTYTGTGSAATVGHGLGVAPGLILLKDRTSGAYNWQVYHSTFAGTSNSIVLNSTAGVDSGSAGVWNSTAPTSTVFSIGTSVGVNTNGNNYVAYCFSPVVGYSSFGTWQHNNSNDGPFIYTGFRPKMILLKNSDNVEQWYIFDSARRTYNLAAGTDTTDLRPNSSAAEGTIGGSATIDFLSNGFKIRTTAPTEIAFGTRNYIYACWAESPFAYSRAR